MLTVFKYPLPIDDIVTIGLPEGAQVLTVQVQKGEPYIWVLEDTVQPLRPRHFRVARTGHPLQPGFALRYIGTFQMDGGAWVFHLFEIEGE